MARRRKLRTVTIEEIERVLQGQEPIDLTVLLELIRNTNPTRAQHLGREERSAQYRQKARLQSLLLRQFGPELEVFSTPQVGIVGIRRRGVRGDACHARLDLLDADVRSTVPLGQRRRP